MNERSKQDETLPIGVSFSAQLIHAQNGTCTVKLEIFRSDDNQNPVLVREFANVARPGVWEWIWDGKLDDGSTAPRGIYLYRLSAYVYGSAPLDRDSNRSDYLFVERAYNENNEPILEAEYWGYDDEGTPDRADDDALVYFIRWYSAHDLTQRDAHAGSIILFDPDLEPVNLWDIGTAVCIAHDGNNDGLVAHVTDDDGDGFYDEDPADGADNDGDGAQSEDPLGAKHGILLHVPTAYFSKAGEYRFLVCLDDDHTADDKVHRCKASLGLNSEVDLLPIRWIGGDMFRSAQFYIAWTRVPLLKRNAAIVKGIKTNVLELVASTGDADSDLPSVQHYVWSKLLAKARDGKLRKGTIIAAVNGTFFNHQSYPYPLIGRVGAGAWPWFGNPAQYHRWAFGVSSTLTFVAERMVPAGTYYDVSSNLSAFPFGFSGIGCLVHNGTPVSSPNEALEGFGEMDGRYARTLCAWTRNQHDFFMIWAKGDNLIDPGLNEGWSWIDARDFLTEFLPYGLYSMNRSRRRQFDISCGMMLDGGSHSDFIYVRVKENVPPLVGSDEDLKRIIRMRYAEVHDVATDGGCYVRGNRSLLQVYTEP